MTILEQAAQNIQQHNLTAAQQCYLQVLQAQPANGKALYGLGYIAQLRQDWPTAIEYLQRACQFLPQQPAPLLGLANAFNQVFSETDALTVLEYAKQQCPADESIQYALTQQYLIMGDITAATSLLNNLLASSNPELFAFACLDAAKINTELLQPSHLARAQLLVAEQPQHSASIRLHYALGLIAKHCKQYEQAMFHWDAANALQFAECDFTVHDMASLFDSLLSVNASTSLSNENMGFHDSSLPFIPVFIVGLPRTGSSLLDKQLCDLSTKSQQISSVGEVDYVASQCVQMIKQLTGYDYPECLEHMSNEVCHAARQRYVDAISQHRIKADFIIDKLPANFQSLPLIYRLFPEAKVLHLKRDLAATALSIYSNDFGAAEPYFCNLVQMQQYFEWYERIMKYFETVYSKNIYSLTYEQFINAPHEELKKISRFIGIDQTYKTMEQEDVNRPHIIKTLSAAEARQPIYRSSSAIPDELAKYFIFTGEGVTDVTR